MESFYTQEDIWRIQEELKVIKAVQAKQGRQIHNHAERLLQVERRGDESKMQNLWTSYFPSVHAQPSFPQLQPFHPIESSVGPFTGFDGQQPQALVTGLPVEEVDLPRRGASRANSVRFDESAIQSHWVSDSHSSSEYLPQRSTGGLGGQAMMERSPSYKSDYKSDRQSSMRSFDNFSMAGSEHEPTFPAALKSRDVVECNTPSNFDSAPAVIRCWFETDCSYDSMLYAVICTGSSKSLIDMSLVISCGLKDQVWMESGEHRISLSLFLGSATVSPENISGHNTLPRLKVEFTVVRAPPRLQNQKSYVQIALGSDILSAIKADVLFSKRQMTFRVRDGQMVLIDFEPDAINFDMFNTSLSPCSLSLGNEDVSEDKTFGGLSGGVPLTETADANQGQLLRSSSEQPADEPKATPPSTSSSNSNIHPPDPQKAPEKAASPSTTESVASKTRATNTSHSIKSKPTPILPASNLKHNTSSTDIPSGADTPSHTSTNPKTKATIEGSSKGHYAAVASKALLGTTMTNNPWGKGDLTSPVTSAAAGGGAFGLSQSGNSSVLPGKSEQGQRRPSRSMKVLRPSTSKTNNASSPLTPLTPVQQKPSADDSTKQQAQAAVGSLNGFNTPGVGSTKPSRSNSLEAGRPVTHTKSRSSTNVVGHATAFKWMSGGMGGLGAQESRPTGTGAGATE